MAQPPGRSATPDDGAPAWHLATRRTPPRPPSSDRGGRPRISRNGVIRRLVPLALAAVVLYGVAPAILEVLGAYKRLRDVDPAWWIVVVGTSAAGNLCMCSLQRLLTGTLALAGVPAAAAALATLAYRLASFWLPLPAGLIAWAWHRRRYGTGSA
jgi:hypothetical protein